MLWVFCRHSLSILKFVNLVSLLQDFVQIESLCLIPSKFGADVMMTCLKKNKEIGQVAFFFFFPLSRTTSFKAYYLKQLSCFCFCFHFSFFSSSSLLYLPCPSFSIFQHLNPDSGRRSLVVENFNKNENQLAIKGKSLPHS